ncbi:MAG: PAS domain-containing protein [Blastocatellia bacterium]|nr:PAS domain-containing protein [Blastocatellia bacterium]
METYLAALDAIGAISNSDEPLEPALGRMGEVLREHLQADGIHVLFCDWDREEMELRVSVGLVETEPGTRYPMAHSLAGHIVLERQAKLYTWDEAQSILHLSVTKRIRPQHLIVTPLIFHDRALGCLLATRLVEQAPFSRLELMVLKAAGQTVANLIGMAPIQAHLDESERTIRLLSDTSRVVNSQLDLDSVLRNTLNRILFALGAEVGSIMLLDEERQELVFRLSRGIPDHLLNVRFRVSEGIAGYVAQTGEPLLVDEGRTNSRFIQLVGQEEFFSMIAVPLKSRGRIIGVLNVDSFDRQRKFTRNDLKLVTALAETVGVAFENARLFDEVEHTRDFAQSTLDSVESVIFTLDRSLQVTSVNSAWKRTTRAELPLILRELAVGTRFLEVVPVESAQHWETVCHEILSASANSPRIHDEEIAFDAGDGRRWMRLTISPLTNRGGETLGLTWVATDITNQHQALAQIAQQANLLRNVRDAIIGLDLEGRVTYWNDGAQNVFGYSAAEAMGQDATQFYLEDQRTDGRRHIQEIMAGRIITGDFRARRRDGKPIWINMRAERLLDTEGNVIGLLNLARDITEQVRTTEKLQVAQEKLRQAELHQALGKMADGVAHNFNNLLMVILGNTQILLSAQTDPQVFRRLESIERAVMEGSALVRRIQNFTQSRKNVPTEPVFLHEILEQTIHFTEARWKDALQSSGAVIALLQELSPAPPILGNANELREVCGNLISNAVEALLAKGGQIICRTFSDEEYVYVQIADSGPGISETVKERIFEPFFTTKGVTKTGLGLSASLGIVKYHQGSLSVESVPGKGATFTAKLPILKAPEPDFPSLSEKPDSPEINLPNLGRILVVDDEPEVATVIAAHLKHAGYTPVVACSGARGVEVFQETPCDLVITDLGMPGLSGWDVVRLVKSLNPLVPTVILTGWANPVESEKAKEHGVDRILEKPASKNLLLETVGQLLKAK